MYSATTVTDIHTESDKGTGYNYYRYMYSATTVTVCTQSGKGTGFQVFKVFMALKLYRYMYMITCTNMYSATAVTVYTQSLTKVLVFRFSRFSWSYNYIGT